MENEKEIHITSLAMLIKPKTSRTSRASVILLHIRSPPICGGVLLKSMVFLCSNEYEYGSMQCNGSKTSLENVYVPTIIVHSTSLWM